VKPLLKIVVLWMMLLALPLQGFAASAMTCCGLAMQAMDDGMPSMGMAAEMAGMGSMSIDPASIMADSADAAAVEVAMPMESAVPAGGSIEAQAAVPLSAETSAAMTAANAPDHHHAAPTADHHSTAASTTCASCAAHCASVAIGSSLAVIGQVPRPATAVIPFRPIPSTAFVPGTPERPPQPFLV
jgi:hypothetical protein